jgi:hypothetical protein
MIRASSNGATPEASAFEATALEMLAELGTRYRVANMEGVLRRFACVVGRLASSWGGYPPQPPTR